MAFNLFPQTDFRQMDLNYVLEVSKQAAANLKEYAADKEQVVATQEAAEEALAAAQQDIQTATQAAASAGQDAQTATQAAGTATQAAADAERDAQTASAAAATATAVQESIPADYTTLSNDVDNLKSDLSFYNFGYCTSRIDWDTVNKTITIGTGFLIYGGDYYIIRSTVTLSYDNFNLTTVLLYNGSAFEFRTFRNLVAGKTVALFYVDKMYTPFDYSNVYVNGNAITTSNVFNDFSMFVNDINTKVDGIDERVDGIDERVDGIDERVDGIDEKLNLSIPEETVYNENNETKSYATSDSIWILNQNIPKNSLITTFDVYVRDNTEKTFKISLWNTETGEKYLDKEYTITPIRYVVHVPFYEMTVAPTKIGFYSASAFETVTIKEGSSLLYVAPDATSISDASTLTKWALNATIKAAFKEEPPVLTQEIHVGEGLDFEEIQDAIESVDGNYATIIVHPKNTPYGRFSLMRTLNGTYPWSGLASVKHISIIGVDKSKCVIQSNTGNYDTPPAEIATNGIIKNLTFIATHTSSDGTETTGSYAVHVDNRPRDTNGMKLTFENCDFVSYQTAAVGLGLYQNQDILFDRCNFKSYTDSTWKPNENYDSSYMCSLGAYFMHTTMGHAGGNMFIRFRNCFLYHEGGNYAMRIADADNIQTAMLEAIGNTLWDAKNQTPGYYTTNNPIMQQAYNHGNNATALNQIS